MNSRETRHDEQLSWVQVAKPRRNQSRPRPLQMKGLWVQIRPDQTNWLTDWLLQPQTKWQKPNLLLLSWKSTPNQKDQNQAEVMKWRSDKEEKIFTHDDRSHFTISCAMKVSLEPKGWIVPRCSRRKDSVSERLFIEMSRQIPWRWSCPQTGWHFSAQFILQEERKSTCCLEFIKEPNIFIKRTLRRRRVFHRSAADPHGHKELIFTSFRQGNEKDA